MKVASRTDLKEADAQGTILLIKVNGIWYGNGTVGDAEDLGEISTSSSTSTSSTRFGYSKGWESKYSTNYSAAGAASVLLCGIGLVKAYKRATRRCVELASGEGTRTPQPLIEIR